MHYLTGGKAEGRIYEGSAGSDLKPVAIDPTSRDSWYLVSHDAAFMAVAKGEAKSGLDYFLKVGIDKGDTYGMLNRDRFGDASSLERQYLARNLDVAAAVAGGTYINGLAHYLAYGYKEADRGGFGRLDPSKLGGLALGDAERKYLQANLDVGQAIADGRYQGDGLQHYLTWGYKESNRGSYGGLKDDILRFSNSADVEAKYLLQNNDVTVQIIGGTRGSGFDHFIKYGRFESWRSGYGVLTNDLMISASPNLMNFFETYPLTSSALAKGNPYSSVDKLAEKAGRLFDAAVALAANSTAPATPIDGLMGTIMSLDIVNETLVKNYTPKNDVIPGQNTINIGGRDFDVPPGFDLEKELDKARFYGGLIQLAPSPVSKATIINAALGFGGIFDYQRQQLVQDLGDEKSAFRGAYRQISNFMVGYVHTVHFC